MRQNQVTRGFLLVTTLVVSLAGQMMSFGQEVSSRAVNKAHDFLKTEKRGKQINDLMHFGTAYSGHEYLRTSLVKDSGGSVIPGEFALVYRFWWDKQYSTELIVFCTASGNIDSLRTGASDGIVQAPFVAAQATISLFAAAINQIFGNEMTADQRRELQQIIDKADAKALLEMQLKLQQALGQ